MLNKNSTVFYVVMVFFFLVGYEALYGFWGTLLRSAGPVIGGLLRGGCIGAVDIVVVRDSSSALSLSPSLSASSVIFWRVKCDARESFAPFPFYFGLRYIVWTLWNCLGIFCIMGNIAQFGPLYPLLSRLHYIFEPLLASSFFQPSNFCSVSTIFAVRRAEISFTSRPSCHTCSRIGLSVSKRKLPYSDIFILPSFSSF
jgi:hypothetical protein